jgi:hypothetical protein
MRMFHKLRPLSLNFGRNIGPVGSVFKKFTSRATFHKVRQADKENPFPDVDHNSLAGGMEIARAAKTAKEREEIKRMVLQNQMHSSLQAIISKM